MWIHEVKGRPFCYSPGISIQIKVKIKAFILCLLTNLSKINLRKAENIAKTNMKHPSIN
jgi:hypothetical protein